MFVPVRGKGRSPNKISGCGGQWDGGRYRNDGTNDGPRMTGIWQLQLLWCQGPGYYGNYGWANDSYMTAREIMSALSSTHHYFRHLGAAAIKAMARTMWILFILLSSYSIFHCFLRCLRAGPYELQTIGNEYCEDFTVFEEWNVQISEWVPNSSNSLSLLMQAIVIV